MNKKDERITKLILSRAEALKENLSAETIKICRKMWEPYSYEEIEAAFFTWMKPNGFFPRPNEIIKIIEDKRYVARERERTPVSTANTEKYVRLRKNVDWEKNIMNIQKINSKLN